VSGLTYHTNCSILAISKYFLEELGNDGLNKLLVAYDDKSADAVCTFAFSLGPTSEPLIFQGRLQVRVGKIRWLKFEHEADCSYRAKLFLREDRLCSVRVMRQK
jgi:hypothetical protein